MGYSIYIGEKIQRTVDGMSFFEVQQVTNDNAPYWEGTDISGKTNGRHPSYCQMSEWANGVGLYDMFFNTESGLLKRHPGCVELTQEHMQLISKAKDEYLLKNPLAEAGWDGKDCFLARLIWYEWWIKWALDNCKNPAMSNG